MVQLHPGLLSSPRPPQPVPASSVAPFLSAKPCRGAVTMRQAKVAFRADLLAVTRNLRAFALTLLGDSERADDLVQETLLRALEKWDRFEPGTNLQAWAFTLMRTLFYSDYRQRRREVEDVDGLFAANVAIPAEQPSRIEFAELRSALMRLPAEQREAVLLVGAEGYSYEEAAVICGTKVGTIKSRVNRARKHLAELLGHAAERDWS
jgi:RNA polymerase sigma-70 factor, ECF subfamily